MNPLSVPEGLLSSNHGPLGPYQAWLKQRGMTPNTVRMYVSSVRHFLDFLPYSNPGNQALHTSEALEAAIDEYVSLLRETKAKAMSVNGNINALKSLARFLNFPIAPIARERSVKRNLDVLTLEEQMRFLRCVEQQPSARDRALCLVIFYTGLRIGDCALLKADHVAAAAQSINLDNAVLPLNKQTSVALLQWLEERRKLSDGHPDSSLWLTQRGNRLSIPGITFILKRIGWQAKLVISSEMLRRTSIAYSTSTATKRNQAIAFGARISEATINRYTP
jgi:integrase/recombinase XerC